MRQSQRLQIVLDMELRREQEALDVMQQALARLQTEKNRLAELERYHQEYQEQMRSASRGRVSVTQLQSWQYYISQLDGAMVQQHKQIDRFNTEFLRCRGLWQQAWERREGMARFIASCREREQREADRIEQKEMDEAAGLRFARRKR